MDFCLFLQVSHFCFFEHNLELFGRADNLVGFVEDGDILRYCCCHFEGGGICDLVPDKLMFWIMFLENRSQMGGSGYASDEQGPLGQSTSLSGICTSASEPPTQTTKVMFGGIVSKQREPPSWTDQEGVWRKQRRRVKLFCEK